ncbi:MAG: CHAD domain-containing protein [Hyphomicrobiaceae bacterium]
MAYKFRVEEPIELGVRRIALDQIQNARKQLSNNDDQVDAVHRSRKAFKRVRALLRLIRPTLKSSDYRSFNRRFRDLGRQLAQSRDFDVMLQTIDSLEVAHDLIDSRMTSSTRAAVVEARRIAVRDAGEPPIEAALKELSKAQEDFKKLGLSRCSLKVVGKQLELSARDFATFYAAARSAPGDAAVHEWRKRVQYHRRHVALLIAAWPEMLQPRVDALKLLSEQLGRDQDLAVLAAFVMSCKPPSISKADGRDLVRLCRQEQSALRGDAFTLGALLAAEKPRSLRRRVTNCWAIQGEQSPTLKLAAE